MRHPLNLLKFGGPALLAVVSLLLLGLPVLATPDARDIPLSSGGAAAPEVEISADGKRLAVVYYKQATSSGAGAVYLKSATFNPPAGQGWVSSTFLGLGSNPSVTFKRGTNNIVYVVWVNSTDTTIQSARCSLNLTTPPTCVAGAAVKSGVNLGSPDIVADNDHLLHVAWSSGNAIETTRSSAVDSVAGWKSPITPGTCSGSRALEPVIGWTPPGSDKLHLAFLCGSATNPATSVEYRRSNTPDHTNPDSGHNWNLDPASFFIFNGVTGQIANIHTQLSNLALAAAGSQVSLVWDGLRTGQTFGLMSTTSTDEGASWPTRPAYVPSGGDVFGPGSDEDKLSTTSGVPPQEYGLRPSLVISGSAGSAAIVWQQRLSSSCALGSSSSSEVVFVTSQTAVTQNLGHDKTNYAIDPDMAVGPGSQQHFVFMKDEPLTNPCTGGLASDYSIFYRGPITFRDNDKGEIGDGNIYLPLILK